MKSQELINSMKELLEEIKDMDPQQDISNIFKNSGLGKMYESCLSNEEIKDIPNKRALNEPLPEVNDIVDTMLKM